MIYLRVTAVSNKPQAMNKRHSRFFLPKILAVIYVWLSMVVSIQLFGRGRFGKVGSGLENTSS
jgi:hypothetical protein